MDTASRWVLTEEEKEHFITILTPNLSLLRKRADISQEELANLIGVSRQTYSAIERKIRRMSWGTYLSLVMFFDHNQTTHKLMRTLSLFPTELVMRFNDGEEISDFGLSEILGDRTQEVVEELDEQALQTIRQTAMLEYARCTKLPSDEVVKSFNGLKNTEETETDRELRAMRAIRAIIEEADRNGNQN